MTKHIEYEFHLPDGSKRYEIVYERSDVFVFQRMHGAVAVKLVRQGDA